MYHDENILNMCGEVMSGCEESFLMRLAMQIFSNLWLTLQPADQSALIVESWNT